MTKHVRTFNHGDKEARYRKACERLGSDTPHCIIGDETNPHAIELHHVAGRKFDDETISLCLNHHAQVSDAQKDHPPKIDGCTNPLEAIGHFLLGLGDLVAIASEHPAGEPIREFLIYLQSKLREFGLRLIEMARATPHETFGGVS
jgi:hypothetical protein